MQKKELSESAIRSRLYRKGYKLIATQRYVVYGCIQKKYAIVDADNCLVTSENMDISDVEKWLEN